MRAIMDANFFNFTGLSFDADGDDGMVVIVMFI
jgi:hypothetical protein